MIWRRRPRPSPSERQADPITAPRAQVTSPGSDALFDEVERGRARRQASTGREAADVVHGYEVTQADAAMLRMMAGARFGPDAKVTLPSGKTITGSEMQRWLEAQEGGC